MLRSNDSGGMVYDVCVQSTMRDDDVVRTGKVRLRFVPPGGYFAPQIWGNRGQVFPVPVRDPSPIRPVMNTDKFTVWWSLVDAMGVRWQREPDGELQESVGELNRSAHDRRRECRPSDTVGVPAAGARGGCRKPCGPCAGRPTVRSMRRHRLLAPLLVATLGVLSWGSVPSADAARAAGSGTVKHWTIRMDGVGPFTLGEPLAQVRARHATYPCGGQHHPCYFKGALGYDLEFDVSAANRVKELMVNAASGHGYAFATRQGIRRGTTIATLKSKLHPRHIGDYGYGDAYDVHHGTHEWMTFFTDGKAVYSIVVSTTAKPVQGR